MQTNLIGKIYFSREDRIAEILSEDARVQYQDANEDANRIQDAFGGLAEKIDELDDAVCDYLEVTLEDPDEDSAAKISYHRRQLIEQWTLAQGSLSKLAWVLRIDGNEAVQRMLNAFHSEQAMDMSGL